MHHATDRSTRTGAATRTFLVGLALLLLAAPVWAQPFVITLPAGGSLQPVGQPIAITWSGGDPSWTVQVFLIDVTANAHAASLGSVPNNGVVFGTI